MREHLVRRLQSPGVAFVMPEAPHRSWYAGRFNAAVPSLEPALSRALATVAEAVELATGEADAVILAGFSQGGCLAAELLARQGPSGLAGAAILTGALIGERTSEDELRELRVRLDGLPIEMVSSARDEWVAPGYVRATAESLRCAGANVRLQITEEPEHRIDEVAVRAVDELLARVARAARKAT